MQAFEAQVQELLSDSSSSGAEARPKELTAGAYTAWKHGSSANHILTNGGINVKLIKGSITDQKVDVVVNLTSTDGDLSTGAISKLLLKTAGNDIEKQLKKHTPIRNGCLVYTSGGKSSWKKIYHGVCSNHTSKYSSQELTEYIRKCLKQGHDDKFHTMAFPSLGTGNLKFPPKEVARIMFDEISAFSEEHSLTSLADINIVIFDQDIFQEFQKYVQDLLSGFSRGGIRTTAIKTKSSEWAKAGASKFVTSSGVKVTLKKGDVVQQKVDVLVNLGSRNLDLKKGAISQIILTKGGQSIQDELKKISENKPWGIIHGEVVETGAGKLDFKKIYHGACSRRDDARSIAHEELNEFVSSCLKKAHNDNMKSIAFPSLGTGYYKFTPAESAKCLFKQVEIFSHKHPHTQLKDIHFVVFDTKIKEVFDRISGKLVNKKRHLVQKTDAPDWMASTIHDSKAVSGDILHKKPVAFRIYGTSRSKIREVIGRINDLCDREVIERLLDSTIDQDYIQKLSQEQIDAIEGLQSRYGVEISVQQGHINKIKIQGAADRITDVVTRIYKVFKATDIAEREESELYLLSNQAQWQYEEDGFWEDYPPEINAIIEKARLEKHGFAEWEERTSATGPIQSIKLDFKTKKETCLSGASRDFEVRRLVEGFEEGSTPEKKKAKPKQVCPGKPLDLIKKLKDLLNIDELLDSEHDICYCSSCHKTRGDKSTYDRGEPSKTYAVPVGWLRFGLDVPKKANLYKAFQKWHRAYHGTKVGNVKKILAVGDLVLPGVKVVGGDKIGERPGHFCDDRKPDGFNTKQVFVTPSIVYAGLETYATSSSFKVKKKEYKVQTALQVLISPKSYKVGKETVGAGTRQLDPLFKNDELEWSTDEHGAIIIYGVLMKIEEK